MTELKLEDCVNATCPWSGKPVSTDSLTLYKGKVVGWVTSGGYAHYVHKSMAQGYVPKELATDLGSGAFEIEIIGDNRKATIITDPLFDPEGKRMRA